MHTFIGKISLSFLCALLCTSTVSTAQDNTSILIGKVRAEYQKINSEKLRKVYVEPKNESSEGGDVYRYYSGDTLRKIVTDYMGAIGGQTSEYYFSNGQLCFAFIVEYRYDKPMSGHVIERIENRYYFHNRRLIRWIDEHGKNRDKSLYAEKAKQILADEDLKWYIVRV